MMNASWLFGDAAGRDCDHLENRHRVNFRSTWVSGYKIRMFLK
jgi:hypothetical protein